MVIAVLMKAESHSKSLFLRIRFERMVYKMKLKSVTAIPTMTYLTACLLVLTSLGSGFSADFSVSFCDSFSIESIIAYGQK